MAVPYPLQSLKMIFACLTWSGSHECSFTRADTVRGNRSVPAPVWSCGQVPSGRYRMCRQIHHNPGRLLQALGMQLRGPYPIMLLPRHLRQSFTGSIPIPNTYSELFLQRIRRPRKSTSQQSLPALLKTSASTIGTRMAPAGIPMPKVQLRFGIPRTQVLRVSEWSRLSRRRAM